MITNKDIRVENGNLVLNGDKYPLDGQSPEAIMDIVEDNSDTTPTENSTAPVTSGGVYTALGTKQDTLTFDSAPTDASTNPVTSGGLYNTIGDLTQTGLTGDSVAAQLGGAKTYVDNAVAKTSITPTLNSGFVMDNGSITISNQVCYFAPNFYYSSDFTVGTAVNVGTLPSNCKPKTGIRIASLSGTAELLGVIMIDTGGAIKYYPAHISRYFGYVQACFEVK